MKLKGLLVVFLVLAILLPLTSIFQSASIPYAAFSGTGQNTVVVAKEDYVFASILITVQPLGNVSNVQVVGGPLLPPAITLPNGTTLQVSESMTFVFTLPNTVAFPLLQYSASGPGYQVSPASPVSAQILSGQNSTVGIPSSIPGIHVYQYTVTGDAVITVHVLGVSL